MKSEIEIRNEIKVLESMAENSDLPQQDIQTIYYDKVAVLRWVLEESSDVFD